jgi:hypothetical protein
VKYFNKRIEEHLNASLADYLPYIQQSVQPVLNVRVLDLWSEAFFSLPASDTLLCQYLEWQIGSNGGASGNLCVKGKVILLSLGLLLVLFSEGFVSLFILEEVMRYFNKRIEDHLNAYLVDRTSLTYNSQYNKFLFFAFWACGTKPCFARKRHSFVPVLGIIDQFGRS